MPAKSLRALLANAIDYAGLFPPAELALEPALQAQSTYVRSAEDWMLGAFVLPIGRVSAAQSQFSLFDSVHPLRISALGSKTTSAAEFQTAVAEAAKAIRFLAGAQPAVRVEQFEMPLPPGPISESLGRAAAVLGEFDLKIFWEAPADRAAETIEALSGSCSGFKLRTGGVTADAFPGSRQIAEALVASGKFQLPIKFTAGLHHPVRHFHPSVQTKMHGFLNVLGAGVLAVEHSWDVDQTTRMLVDEISSCFFFDDRRFHLRDLEIGVTEIDRCRQLITSLGSCSFDEPREDLRALGLFP
jgi:hypothetical protein